MLQRRISPAKNYMRRTLQIVAFVGTLLVGIIALALIVSQTPWFRDWLRKYVVRQAGTYVNGTVSIGSLGGNLFYGVQLGDVAVEVNGEHVVTLKSVEIKYSVVGAGLAGRHGPRDPAGGTVHPRAPRRERMEPRQAAEEAGAGSRPQGASQAAVAAVDRDRQRTRRHRRPRAVARPTDGPRGSMR